MEPCRVFFFLALDAKILAVFCWNVFLSRCSQVIDRFSFGKCTSVCAAILISMAIALAELPYWLYRINALARKLNPLLIRRCFSLPRIGVFNSLTRAQSRGKYFIFLLRARADAGWNTPKPENETLFWRRHSLFSPIGMQQINIFAFGKIFFSPSLNRSRRNSASAAIDFHYYSHVMKLILRRYMH